MSKLLPFLPTGAGLIAFILSILCLFAGSQTDFQTGCDLLTLFTPRVGNGAGVHDFYSIYAMTYCDGSLGADGRGRNITGCSSRTIPFSFNPTEALLRDVPYDTSLAALGWPDAITGDFRAFALTTHTMSVLYCMGAAMAGAGIMARLGLEIAEKPRRRLAEGSLFLASFTSLGIASIIASVMSFEFVALINYHGKGSGVTAQYGRKFLGMSWTAVVLLLAGSVLSLVFPVGSQEGTGTGAAKVVEEP